MSKSVATTRAKMERRGEVLRNMGGKSSEGGGAWALGRTTQPASAYVPHTLERNILNTITNGDARKIALRKYNARRRVEDGRGG